MHTALPVVVALLRDSKLLDECIEWGGSYSMSLGLRVAVVIDAICPSPNDTCDPSKLSGAERLTMYRKTPTCLTVEYNDAFASVWRNSSRPGRRSHPLTCSSAYLLIDSWSLFIQASSSAPRNVMSAKNANGLGDASDGLSSTTDTADQVTAQRYGLIAYYSE